MLLLSKGIKQNNIAKYKKTNRKNFDNTKIFTYLFIRYSIVDRDLQR